MSKKLFLLTSFVLVLALACTNVSFGATIERTIANGTDDVEERPSRGNVMDIDSTDLEFPYEDKNMGDPQVIGLRFLDIAIPKGATITNASVQFKVDETKDGTLAVNVIIDGELAANAAAFTADAFNVTSRVRTTANVKWSVPNWATVGDRGPDQATPNIAAVIQEVVNQDGWVSGNALVLTISDDLANPSAGLRCAEAFEGEAPNAPMLHIEYEEAPPPPPPPPPPPAPIIVDIRITDGLDDYEERVDDGSMDVGSTDLELAYETGGTPATREQIIGLRFVNIPVAKGVQITGAYVEFEVDKVNKVGSQEPVNLIIEGELTPNAAAFADTAFNISQRLPNTTTAKVKWSVPPWTAQDEKFQTADVSSIIQEIVNQDGWTSGNALVLLIRDDKDAPSTGLREAEAFEGEAPAAPLLHIEYTEAAPPPVPVALVSAFAFGSRLLDCPTYNDPAVKYTMVHHTSPQAIQYDPARGYGYEVIYPVDSPFGNRAGYGIFGPFDDSPNNRNKFPDECPEQLYDSVIGAKSFTNEVSAVTMGDPNTPSPNPEGIIFRVDVPNGSYRFVGAFGDADNVHAHRILAEDGGSGPPANIGLNQVVLVSNFDQAQQTIGEADAAKLGEGVFARVGFDGKIPPPGDGVAPSPQFVNIDVNGKPTSADASSPVLEVTQGYIRIHQLQGNSNNGPGGSRDANGGDIVILELWKVGP